MPPTPPHRLLTLVVAAWAGFLTGAAVAVVTGGSWWQAVLGGMTGSTTTAGLLIGVYARQGALPVEDPVPHVPAASSDAASHAPEPARPTATAPPRVVAARRELDLAVQAADALADAGEQLTDSDVAAAVLAVHQARLAYARELLVARLPLPEELASELVIGHRSVAALLASYRSGR